MKTRNWKPHKSDQVFIAHDPALCEGRPCCVHKPSDHHMRDWPQNYRTDTKVTERICPHGVGHPDPDQTWPKDDPHWVHGCDGCCNPNPKPLDETTPPVCLIHTTLDVPAEIYEAAGTLHNFFTKEGHQNWQFEGIADHRLIAKLQQEKRELWDECVAMRKAIEVAFDALDDADGSSYHIDGDACLTKDAKKQRRKALEQLKPFTSHD